LPKLIAVTTIAIAIDMEHAVAASVFGPICGARFEIVSAALS